MTNDNDFYKITNHLIKSGFFYPGSQIYGGISNIWDYGPLGVELKNNLKRNWWKHFVQKSKYNVGIDSAIFMNKKVWEATKHASTFNDPLIDCKNCKVRYRVDELINLLYKNKKINDQIDPKNIDQNIINNLECPSCGKKNVFTNIRQFNMMFKLQFGVVGGNEIYLRPETAQGVFVNFKNIQRSSRKKIPFGICNVGKSFRNEITPRNFIFRIREFEQLELEFFCHPKTDTKWFDFWQEECLSFIRKLNINQKKIRFREHDAKELAFYSKRTIDIEYNFPNLGWGEILGIANRTDYDLKCHMDYSKESLEYFDTETNEKYIPYCVESSMGLERLILMILIDSYDEEKVADDTRIVMHIKANLAPYKVAVLPLSKQLNDQAKEIFNFLCNDMMCIYDDNGSIGKRYRRGDAIGIPYAITIDFETLNDNCVTIRDRDTMKQVRIKIADIRNFILDKIKDD